MKLCEYCIKNVLQSKESWDYHHASYHSTDGNPSLGGSAIERCLFCATLKEDIDGLAPHLQDKKNTGAWPVHRWNIRGLSKIRESLDTVVVTFRYVPPSNVVQHDSAEAIDLPSRTFFLFPENDLQPLLSKEQVGGSTNPALNGGHQIRSWIDTCDASHEDCMKRRKAAPKAKRFVPTRLLDISGPPEAPIRIVEKASTSIQGPYCSLSHCWGKPKFIELHKETRKHYMEQGVEWHLLSKNFQEAIEIARSLEVGYIWIDSLCIIQDSNEDWMHEAARMHLVYRNSYCNIAIADSPDSTKGAFRKRNSEDIVPVRYSPSENSPFFRKKTWMVVPENLWDRDLLQSYLYVRGWVFQERMLSPRILHFAKKQIFWDCPSLSACETLPAGLPQPMDNVAGPDRHWRGRLQEPEDSHEALAGANDQSMEAFWKTAVRKYTSCNLTKGRDKLIAMWGIAKLVRDIMNVEYGKGLFEENLEDQLAWRVEECTLTQRPSESKEEDLARNIPSWSWASMDGTIIVPDRLSDQLHFKVTDHQAQPLTFDLVGVKRFVRPAPSRAGAGPPPMPARGISDSGPELQRRDKEREKEQDDVRKEKDFHRSSSPEKIDRSQEPRFHSTSISIQGHVGRAQLEYNKIQGNWQLQLDGKTVGNVEVFPDLIPDLSNPVDKSPFFIILAAKQVIKPPLFMLDTTDGTGPSNSLSSTFESDDDTAEEFDYAGHGILMKDVGNHHFHRTGAFRFRNVGGKSYRRLQQTVDWEKIPPKLYNNERGRKIWLD